MADSGLPAAAAGLDLAIAPWDDRLVVFATYDTGVYATTLPK
jgi:hypothetical protein